MKSFTWSLPSIVRFGTGVFEVVGEVVASVSRRPLVVTGRSGLRRGGLRRHLEAQFAAVGIQAVWFEGVEPNPRDTTCNAGAALARERGCEAVLAVGGGSVMDAGKAIAAAAASGAQVWDYIRHAGARWRELNPVDRALPIVAVPTTAATGSETNDGAIITNWATHEKAGIFGPALLPRAAVIDPSLTVTVPPGTTADGGVDMFCHVLEPYLTGTDEAPVVDRLAEGLVTAIVEAVPAAVARADDLVARSTLSWASSLALMGIVQEGRPGPFPVHALEHAVSGHTDVAHGRGLAAILPAWLDVVAARDPERIAELGRRVFGIGGRPEEAAFATVGEVCGWLRRIGCAPSLTELGVTPELRPRLVEDVLRLLGGRPAIGGRVPLVAGDLLAILAAGGPPT